LGNLDFTEGAFDDRINTRLGEEGGSKGQIFPPYHARGKKEKATTLRVGCRAGKSRGKEKKNGGEDITMVNQLLS